MINSYLGQIKVIYEDADLVVLDKPRGVVVNRAESVKEETVQDFVEDKFQIPNSKQILRRSPYDSSESIGQSTKYLPRRQAGKIQNNNGTKVAGEESDFYRRSGIVHRLDKETSGVLMVAKNPQSFVELQRQFKERRIEKKYTALVHGKIVAKEGTIKAPVGRTPWDREKFGVLPEGKESVTEYEAVQYYTRGKDKFTLLQVYPMTGRTHQIRVHFKYFGHPIVADEKYVGRKRYRKDKQWCSRMFLHAKSISFTQPRTKRKITVESDLPMEIKRALGELNEID